MKLKIIAVDKIRTPYYLAGVSDYLTRIRRMLPIEQIEVPTGTGEVSNGKGAGALSREAASIERHLKPGSKIVVMDSAGKPFSSEQLYDWLQEEMNRATGQITFVIGGAWGIAKPLVDRADLKLSLSKMTFPHELARLILTEQIYRALSIWKGLPYHK